jgi:lipoic acid synthetase
MLPEWLSVKPATTERYAHVKDRVSELSLHTVCVEARCPNITECWSGGTATFMVLGSKCTRGCRFCAVSKSAVGDSIDREEPQKLATVIKEWGLSYVVVTSVARDDLEDQGSLHFAACIKAIKERCPNTIVEVLIPDFQGSEEFLKNVVDAKPDVIGNNIETVERLSKEVRDRMADYWQSIKLLDRVKLLDRKIYTKSAIMLGIGERAEEVVQSMLDLRAVGVDFVAIGQYLKPKGHHLEVKEFIRPEIFEEYRKKGMELGFRYVASGPFVRSSYRAGEHFISNVVKANSSH